VPPLIVTAAVIERDGRILITRRPEGSRHAGFWEFPGGKLEEGESPQEALARELLEELDLPVEVEQLLDAIYYEYDWGPVLILVYQAKPLATRIRNLQVAEHRWVNRDSLADYQMLPADAPMVDKLAHSLYPSLLLKMN
jgi:8-oxo-dGTP diphosphatase